MKKNLKVVKSAAKELSLAEQDFLSLAKYIAANQEKTHELLTVYGEPVSDDEFENFKILLALSEERKDFPREFQKIFSPDSRPFLQFLAPAVSMLSGGGGEGGGGGMFGNILGALGGIFGGKKGGNDAAAQAAAEAKAKAEADAKAKEQKKMFMYVGIGIAVLILVVIIIKVSKK